MQNSPPSPLTAVFRQAGCRRKLMLSLLAVLLIASAAAITVIGCVMLPPASRLSAAGAGIALLLTQRVQPDGVFDPGLNRASANPVPDTGISVLF